MPTVAPGNEPNSVHIAFGTEPDILLCGARCKQTRKLYTFCVVNCCARNNNLQSPVGQLKTQRGNLLIPNAAKDATKDAKDVGDSTNEQYEPRDSSTPPGGRRRQ